MQEPEKTNSSTATQRRKLRLWVSALGGILLIAIGVWLGVGLLSRVDKLTAGMADLARQVEGAGEKSEQALARAREAAALAEEAARGRMQAEAEAAEARSEAESAREREQAAAAEAGSFKEQARLAREEADRIRQDWEQEANRLQAALNQIVDTRRTALGLVMNLSEDYLKFEFDKADLTPENRELLSRIAGILLTSQDYSIAVYGHTDDIGSDEYNQKLSERRAQAVRDYLVAAGLDPSILTTEGYGKRRPLVPEKTVAARAKNRRVEIGLVNTRIRYERASPDR